MSVPEKLYRVHIVETVDYVNDYYESELRELLAKGGLTAEMIDGLYEGDLAAAAQYDDSSRAPLEDDMQRYGDVREMDFHVEEVNR